MSNKRNLGLLSAAALAPDVKDIAGARGSEALDRDVRTTPREMTLARFVYGVALNGRLVGFLNETVKDEAVIELGYVIHPDWQNRGYMTEALAAAIGTLFQMGYRAVRAAFFQGNMASRRVMEKCGMTPTGETEEIEYRGEKRICVYYEIKVG